LKETWPGSSAGRLLALAAGEMKKLIVAERRLSHDARPMLEMCSMRVVWIGGPSDVQ
jgi:hypothetical protein